MHFFIFWNLFFLLLRWCCLFYFCEILNCSVTLYAEFLPTKQRAKCVVLLDVSIILVHVWPRFKLQIHQLSVHDDYFCFVVFLGIRCLSWSGFSFSCHAHIRYPLAFSLIHGSFVIICNDLSCELIIIRFIYSHSLKYVKFHFDNIIILVASRIGSFSCSLWKTW